MTRWPLSLSAACAVYAKCGDVTRRGSHRRHLQGRPRPRPTVGRARHLPALWRGLAHEACSQPWLTDLGISWTVVAPSLQPRGAGERIKTDRRDARKLVGLFREGTDRSARADGGRGGSPRSVAGPR